MIKTYELKQIYRLFIINNNKKDYYKIVLFGILTNDDYCKIIFPSVVFPCNLNPNSIRILDIVDTNDFLRDIQIIYDNIDFDDGWTMYIDDVPFNMNQVSFK